MRLLRNWVDRKYDRERDILFAETDDDPLVAHEHFVKWVRLAHRWGLERLFLNCRENRLRPGFELSNAAGLNKDGDIPPTVLKHLGFDRVVVGTVTADPWKGNPRPNIKRYPGTNSMVNWMGLPGLGSKRVAETLASYGNHRVPITINLMSTPGKQGDELLRDLETTMLATRDLPYVTRFELNISCPNTHAAGGGIDARDEYQRQNADMLRLVTSFLRSDQELYEKVSPDLDIDGVRNTLAVSMDYVDKGFKGFTDANTTREHDPRYITSPPNLEGVGGASGDAVYVKARDVQTVFSREIRDNGYDLSLIACGGINTASRIRARTEDRSVIGAQIFTPLIFEGPKLIRKLRAA